MEQRRRRQQQRSRERQAQDQAKAPAPQVEVGVADRRLDALIEEEMRARARNQCLWQRRRSSGWARQLAVSMAKVAAP